MTEPQDSQQQDDEDSALIPAILAAYVAYRAYRGSHDSVPTGWQQLALTLKLRRLLTGPMQMLGQRTLAQQRKDAGRTGDELWKGAEEAVKAGVEAGIQTVAEGLIWTDKQTPAGSDPASRDSAEGNHPGPYMPTAGDPPTLLAQMTASAVRNTTAGAAGTAAGWSKKRWTSKRDSRVRETHAALDGKAIALKELFTSPSGARLRWPGDPRAPMAERANCRCSLTMVRR